MTSLTIELPPEVYAHLQREAQRRGKAEQAIIEELLAEQLTMRKPEQATFSELTPDVRTLLATMTDADMIVPPQGSPNDAIRLFQSWNEEDLLIIEEEGEGTWEDILRSIDMNRASSRKLFSEQDL